MPDRGSKRKRKGRYSFLLTFFVIIALIFAFFLTSSLFFKIKEIKVEGVTVYTAQEVIGLSGFSQGENIFLINKVSAVQAIRAKLPYVKSIRIKRELPGTVVIILTEAAPAAMIEDRGLYWLFDTQGILLDSAAVPAAPKLPVVKGAALRAPLAGDELMFSEEEASKREPLLSILKSMQAAGLWEGVGEIDISQIANIRFTYQGGYVVELGAYDMIDKKLLFMQSALEKLEGRGPGTLILAPVAEDKEARFIPDGG